MSNLARLFDFRTKLEIVDVPTLNKLEREPRPETELERLSRLFSVTESYLLRPKQQPYVGDVFDCKYTTSNIVYSDHYPFPLPRHVNIANVMRDDDGVVVLGSGAEKHGDDEAFQYLDLKYKRTLLFLQSLPDKTRIKIITRSDLIAYEQYIDELKRLDVTITMLTIDESIQRDMEPGAPSIKRRMIAVKKLRENKIKVKIKKIKLRGEK